MYNRHTACIIDTTAAAGRVFVKHLVIDRRIIKNNLRAIKERAEGAAIYADLSANASGMGLFEIAKLLRDDGVRHYAASDPKDAAHLRSNGFTEETIMMLRSTADPEEIAQLIDQNVICIGWLV